LGKAKYLLWALVIPLIYCLIVYGITWITGLGGFPDPDLMQAIETRWSGTTTSPALQIILTVALSALLTIPVGLISAMGEEIGWRGLLVPELAKITSFSNASLISGLIWALWHFPLLFFADYNLPGAPLWYAALMFTILVIGISYAFAYLRLKSGSVWPAGLMHSSHNVFVQNIFTPLTVQTALTPYIIDEFGIGLALAGIGVAVIFWQLSKKLPAADSKQPGR
jgi:membrane protease YdiL (CAAX protease family)